MHYSAKPKVNRCESSIVKTVLIFEEIFKIRLINEQLAFLIVHMVIYTLDPRPFKIVFLVNWNWDSNSNPFCWQQRFNRQWTKGALYVSYQLFLSTCHTSLSYLVYPAMEIWCRPGPCVCVIVHFKKQALISHLKSDLYQHMHLLFQINN